MPHKLIIHSISLFNNEGLWFTSILINLMHLFCLFVFGSNLIISKW